jgi:hypothetical protein
LESTPRRHTSQTAELNARGLPSLIDGIEIGGQEQQPEGRQRQHPVLAHQAAETQLPVGLKQPELQQLAKQRGLKDL